MACRALGVKGLLGQAARLQGSGASGVRAAGRWRFKVFNVSTYGFRGLRFFKYGIAELWIRGLQGEWREALRISGIHG